MADRSEQLASALDGQNTDLARFLAGRAEADLLLPCEDPGGATVGAVLSHLAEGHELVLGWLDRAAGGDLAGHPGHPGQPEAGAGAGEHQAGHQQHDLRTHGEVLGGGGEALAARVRGLTDCQLDLVPAAAKGITDGTMPLAAIIGRMIEHQHIHLDYITRAVPGLTGVSERS